VVPKVVGLRLARAEARLTRLHLAWKVRGKASPGVKVIAQTPRPRVAADRGLVVTLVVAGG
jgi:beta-lactam-binding protein with PASTA domain